MNYADSACPVARLPRTRVAKFAFPKSTSNAIALAPVFVGEEQNSVPMALQAMDTANLGDVGLVSALSDGLG
jgi:hypothetical protein